jgi:glyoxylase-like metal-dependent hydrolase (beta-lactamase superfamily II)
VTGFREVADRVWVSRQEWFDLNVCLVGGADGLLVVDTQASGRAARAIVDDVRALGVGPVTAVFNTHEHFDHTFGNGAFADARIHAHRRVGETFMADAERLKDLVRSEGDKDAPELGYTAVDLQDVLATPPRGPDVTFATTSRVDLGDRVVELAHAGRGHTDGDIRIVVPDAGVVFLGDLVEESAPPSLGGDSWPLDWAPTLDAHLRAVGPDTVVVPGHGRPADRNFVTQQRDELAAIATVVRERHAAGIPLPDAQQEADDRLPYPLDHLGDAFARGYAQLSGELDGEPA